MAVFRVELAFSEVERARECLVCGAPATARVEPTPCVDADVDVDDPLPDLPACGPCAAAQHRLLARGLRSLVLTTCAVPVVAFAAVAWIPVPSWSWPIAVGVAGLMGLRVIQRRFRRVRAGVPMLVIDGRGLRMRVQVVHDVPEMATPFRGGTTMVFTAVADADRRVPTDPSAWAIVPAGAVTIATLIFAGPRYYPVLELDNGGTQGARASVDGEAVEVPAGSIDTRRIRAGAHTIEGNGASRRLDVHPGKRHRLVLDGSGCFREETARSDGRRPVVRYAGAAPLGTEARGLAGAWVEYEGRLTRYPCPR